MNEIYNDLWRPMTSVDLQHVLAIAGAVHPSYPEDSAVFAERLRLYPAGCLICQSAGRVVGYGLSHPWRAGAPPALNALLGALPAPASTYYIHDIALLPEARGDGAGAAVVARLLAQARAAGFATVSLVAVSGTAGFWRRFGFRVVVSALGDAPSADPALAAKLRSYDDAACFMTCELA